MMKIIAINGSPKGQASTTQRMVAAVLQGAQTRGAETATIFLADKSIHYCRGCFSCWQATPGKCVINDDMQAIIAQLSDADIIILATPLYFNNISGQLKTFMDRLMVTGNPQASAEKRAAKKPKLTILANCGFPIRSQFDVLSLWVKHVARMMQTVVAGEIFATQGQQLTAPSLSNKPVVEEYFNLLESAGRELATHAQLLETTDQLARQNFVGN